jgi:hypothetical protein
MYRYDVPSNWTQQLYTCASGMKASVKTVTFSSNVTNHTTSLSNLRVLSVQSKNYTQDTLPSWGIEKVDGYNVEEIDLFWGLVNESQVDSSNFDTRRAAELYLPAANHKVTFGHIYDSFAAGQAFAASWNSVYEYAAAVRGVAIDFIPRYFSGPTAVIVTDTILNCSFSGENNYGLTLKYRELSKGPEGAAKILNLIWTDLAAFTTVGTKTGFETGTQPSLPTTKRSAAQPAILGQRDVHRRVRIIEYKDIRYAIPAFIVGGLSVLGAVCAILFGILGIVPWRLLKHFINQASMGRTATQLMEPEAAAPTATTKEWSETAGKIVLAVPGLNEAHGARDSAQGQRLLQSRMRSDFGADSSMDETEMLASARRQGGSGYTSVSRASFEGDSRVPDWARDGRMRGLSTAYLSPPMAQGTPP